MFISYASDNIWGVGASPEAAHAAAVRYGGEDIELLDTVPATDRLAVAIAGFTDGHPIYPSDIKWRIKSDLLKGDIADLVLGSE